MKETSQAMYVSSSS